MTTPTTLLTTLGGQPQRITFMLDLLLARGEAIDQVKVIYIAPYRRSQVAFKRLAGEFKDDRYRGRPCRLQGVEIRTGSSQLVDIRTPAEVEAVRQHISRLLSELKGQGQQVHLGLSGGRLLMSLVALAAAMQYLTPGDCIWHVYVPAEFDERSQEGAILHAPAGAGVCLVAVPFVPWVAYIPGLASLMKRTPQEIGEEGMGWLSQADRQRCARVWEALTRRQRDVLQAFAVGQSRQEVAQSLHISVTTVDSHRDRILEQCELVWGAQAGEGFSARLLLQRFGPFLAGLKRV
jgi:CRISPR-associated protein Csx14